MTETTDTTGTTGAAIGGEHSSPFAALVGRADFRNMLVGQVVSGLGDWMATVALMALVHDLSGGSSTAVGGVLVLRLAPTVLAGPVAARLVDRWDPRQTMLATDALRIGVVAAIPFVDALWWVYLWAFVLEFGGLLFLPARDAAIPHLAEHDELEVANGLMLASSYGTIPLGAGLFAGVAAAGGGTDWAFFADAITFAVSYLFISRIGSIPRRAEADEEGHGGFLAALRLPLVRAIAPVTVMVALGLGALFSLGIVFVRDVLDATDVEFGVLVALFGVGAAVGLLILNLTGGASIARVRWLVAAQGAVVAGMSLAPSVELAFVGAVLFGAATAAALTSAITVLQDRLGDRDRFLAFTAFHVLIRAGLAVAAIGAGAAGDLLEDVQWPGLGQLEPSRVVLLSSGALVLASTLGSRALQRLDERDADSAGDEPGADAAGDAADDAAGEHDPDSAAAGPAA